MALVGAGFRRYATYRLSTFAAAFTNTVFGLLRASVVIATVGAAGGTLAGYDAVSAATYAWLTQALLGPVQVFQWTDLAQQVRTGAVAVDLCRPLDLQAQYLATNLGRALYQLLPRGVPPLTVGAVTFGLHLSDRPWVWVAGAVSVLLSVQISFACQFMVNLTAFWLVEIRGVMVLYVVTSNVLCGLYLPVHWFPPTLARVAAATPFPSMLQAPVDLLSGRLSTPGEVAGTLAVQAAWTVALLAAGRGMLALATRRLVVQGG